MYIYKNFSFKGIMSFAGFHLIWLTIWATIVTLLFEFTKWKSLVLYQS